MLKKIRITVAVLMFAAITFYFLDFVGVLSLSFPNLARIQFVPALLSGTLVVLGLLLLLTFFFGRVYCSVICPLGVLQDVVAWFARRINRKKRYSFSREKKLLRYLVLGGVVVSFFLGGTVALSLLDPYGAFGRMTVNVFRPVYMGMNNLGAAILNYFDNYSLYHTDICVEPVFFVDRTYHFSGRGFSGLSLRAHLLQYDLPGGDGIGSRIPLVSLAGEDRPGGLCELRAV